MRISDWSSDVCSSDLGNPIQISGDANVTNGATLGGDLNIAGALNLTGGTIGPGNSVGIITAASIGGAGLNGTYHAEVNAAGKADWVKITGGGAVDLSGIRLEVAQENGNGGYVLNHDYTILSAAGGLTADTAFASAGLDASLSSSLVKLNPVMYDDGTGIVTIRLSPAAGNVNAVNGTSNQKSTLHGVMAVVGKYTAADTPLSSSDAYDCRPDAHTSDLRSLMRNSYAAF